ncbi:DinB family protein [Paraflavitalea sp. CAU 1676]|uniref:DinB family protein n=1 Tax=Paraflavitalea sp. CAU 1676 TaxID=3032598 RepID=UPI0023DBC4C6|nr:DinB family protein [Paraflavitalea sp. CAU 1676]MDF2189591.1 DinB family protein [Paraflavitalea sp. CAU 1676]
MTIIESLLRELDREAATTRKMLSRVPDDRYDWQPHEKSMSIRRLATHIAELPSWVKMTLETSELDFAANPYSVPTIDNTNDLLAFFDRSLAEGRASLEKAVDEDLDGNWTLRNGDQIYSVESKADVVRMSYCQTVHHRAQLGVYLRLLNVPIPGSYGPSADEMNF